MRVLVVGQGAREHAIVWKLLRSPKITKLFVSPGNPAMSEFVTTIALENQSDPAAIVKFCQASQIDLVVVGPEAYLAAGLADRLQEAGVAVFGPSAQAAQLESSKVFSKEIMLEAGIPTAKAQVAIDRQECDAVAGEMLKNRGGVVLKASGLAAGKGVFVCGSRRDVDNALEHLYGSHMVEAASQVLVEEMLLGRECSFFSFMGTNAQKTLGFAVDFKRLQDGDLGPNTGGMGAYTPVPWLDGNASEEIERQVIAPLCQALKNRGITYQGWLYTGLMWTDEGPKVIEFNVRLGDPEAQVLAIADPADWLETIAWVLGLASAPASLPASGPLQPSVGVVLASPGYPYEAKASPDVKIPRHMFPSPQDLLETAADVAALGVNFAAAIQQDAQGDLTVGKGRVMTCVARDTSLESARARAYQQVNTLTDIWPNALWRRDIAAKVLSKVGEKPLPSGGGCKPTPMRRA